MSAIILIAVIPLLLTSSRVIAKEPEKIISTHIQERSLVNIDSLLKASRSFMFSQPDSARSILKRVHAILPNNASDQKLQYLILTGSTFHVQADYGKALEYFSQALSLALKTGNKTREADVYNSLGKLNLKTGNYKDASNYLLKSLKIYEELGQKAGYTSALNNMGLLALKIENLTKAQDYFTRAYKGFKLQNDSIGISATLGNLGLVQAREGNRSSAIVYFNRAIAIAQQSGNKYGLCISYQGMANLFIGIEKPVQAIEYYKKSKIVALQISHPYQEAYADLGMARVLTQQDTPSEALVLAKEALVIALRINNKPLTYECHEVLSLVYEAAQDYKNSLKHYREYTRIKEEVISQTLLHQIYNQEISSLSESNTNKQLEIEGQVLSLSHKNSIIMLIVVAFIFVVTGLYLIYMNYRHRQNKKLQETIISLSEKKSRAAIEAEIQERKRIGEELHDGLGQMLSVARLNISAMQQKPALSEARKKELLASSLHSVDEAFNELRNISHNLAPSNLSQKGLAGAINDLATQINQSNGLKMEVEIFGSYESLDHLIENSLYRAVQELVNNALKYAFAKKIFVQIIKSDTEITLMIEDNGIGFDAGKVMRNSIGGLKNLKSRIESQNGTIYVDSSEDRGTIVSIVLPSITLANAAKTN